MTASKTTWRLLLDKDVVARLTAQQRANNSTIYLNIDEVELKVTDQQALYFIPEHLVSAFERLDVSFCVRND